MPYCFVLSDEAFACVSWSVLFDGLTPVELSPEPAVVVEGLCFCCS